MSLRYALLGALAEQDRSGYQLVQRFKAAMNFVWTASQGAIYPELLRLEADGLIAEVEAGPRRRKTYRATEAGRQALRDWLLTPPQRQAKDELVLRVFLLAALTPAEAADYFAYLANEYTERLAVYEQRLGELTESEPARLFDDIALRGGIAHESAMRSWAQESEARLRDLADVQTGPQDRGALDQPRSRRPTAHRTH